MLRHMYATDFGEVPIGDQEVAVIDAYLNHGRGRRTNACKTAYRDLHNQLTAKARAEWERAA